MRQLEPSVRAVVPPPSPPCGASHIWQGQVSMALKEDPAHLGGKVGRNEPHPIEVVGGAGVIGPLSGLGGFV